MRRWIPIFWAVLTTLFIAAAWGVGGGQPLEGRPRQTDYETLDRFVSDWSDQVDRQPGRWAFVVAGVPLRVIADEQHNRMRIISQVADAQNLDAQSMGKMLEANFDRTLDARYTIWRGGVWSAFIHPLAELTEDEFHSAVEQVVQLKRNYGTTYSSSELKFGK